MNRKLVLKDKRRFAAVLGVLIIISISIALAGKSYSYKEPQYKLIAVQQGDTLWDIARENLEGSDIRRYIYEIEKLNNISDSIIYPGTQLRIPSY